MKQLIPYVQVLGTRMGACSRSRVVPLFMASIMIATLIVVISGRTSVAYGNDKNGRDNTPAQCEEAHNAVAQGKPLPDLELFRKGHGAIHDGKVTIFDDSDRYSDEIEAAAHSWTQATGGGITFEVVDKPSAHSVRVFDVDREGATWVGWTKHDPHRVLLNVDYLDTMSQDARQGTIAHEFGHLIGLKHGCPGDLMHAVVDNQQAMMPQATDVQAALQEDDARTASSTVSSIPDYLS